MRFVFVLCTFASAYASAGQAHDYVFLYGKLIGCGDRIYVIDYAEVSADGEITLLDGNTINVTGMSVEDVAATVADQIGERTGRTPQSITVEIVPAADEKRIARELMKLTSTPQCRAPNEETQNYPDPRKRVARAVL